MKTLLEEKVLQVIKGSAVNPLFLRGLYLLSRGFEVLVKTKLLLYKKKWLLPKKNPVPTVCVGNITVGGTGKTPFVNLLLQDLKPQLRLAVISTGYKGRGVTKKEVIKPLDCHGKVVPANYCGDEPSLLQRRHPDVEVLICKDRRLALQEAHKRKIQVALLDDGFQRKSIKKDLSVILMRAEQLFGNGYYLPRGFLREPPIALQEAQFICITDVEKAQFENLCQKIRPYSKAKIMGGLLKPVSVKGDKPFSLEGLCWKKVGVFCGIAHPNNFLRVLENLGAYCVETLFVGDHEVPDRSRWDSFIQSCLNKQVELVMCTEKDFVKIEAKSRTLPIGYLEMEYEVCYGLKHYIALKQKIYELSKKKKR